MTTELAEAAETEAERKRREASARKVKHLTQTERAAKGKAARGKVPRRMLGEWAPSPKRVDAVDILERQAGTRVPELVPIRYGRMLVSPFTFYRGAAAIMAADLAEGPQSGLHAQLCGDAHLSNFGAFAAPDRRMLFSVNDFDETHPGPFEQDVKRLVASFAVAGRDRGFDPKVRAGINAIVGRSYRESMRRFASMHNMELWYARIDVEDVVRDFAKRAGAKQRKRLAKNVAHARTKDSLKAFGKLTEVVDGERRIVSDPPLIVPVEELVEAGEEQSVHEAVREIIHVYARTLPEERRRLLERFR